MILAAHGRLSGLHYGTYDYSTALGVAPAHQALDHPVADHAKSVMQVAVAGTGVHVADGSTNVLPVGDTAAVHAAWQLHARLVRRVAWNAASTRAGTCTRRSCRPGTRRPSPSTSTGWPRPAAASTLPVPARRRHPRRARHRPRHGPASCCGASTVERCRRVRRGRPVE